MATQPWYHIAGVMGSDAVVVSRVARDAGTVDPTMPQAPPLPTVPSVDPVLPDAVPPPLGPQPQEQPDQQDDPLVPHPEQWTITDVPADAPTETVQAPSSMPEIDEG